MTTDMQATLQDAMRVIAESADELRAGCAMEINGEHEWPDAEDKAEYDRRIAVLESIRALASRPDAQADERGANPNRASDEPGGQECTKCGRIFIGGPEHDVCGICAPAPQAQGVPGDVRAAVERMCSPLHESRLSGVTAQQDARCMKLIRDYMLGTDAVAPDLEQAGEASGLSRHSRAMLLNVLCHHQGGSSSVGQPIRAMLGIGQHDRLTDEQLAEAKWIDGLLASPSRECGEQWPADRDAAIQACALMILGICKTRPQEVWPKEIEGRIRYMLSKLQPQAAVPQGQEEQPSFTNPLTPYGMLVRALRIVTGTTLYDMAKALLTTPAKLSSMEFGRMPVTQEFALDVAAYFDALGVPDTLAALTVAANARALLPNNPRLGTVSKPQKAMCSCCERSAINRIDIQEDHMRGNDEVMHVCDVHMDMAREENWRTLYRDFNNERQRRRNKHQE